VSNRCLEVASIPWPIRLSWLENAYSRPLFGPPIVRYTHLVFDVRSGFIDRSVRARYKPLCRAVTIYATLVNRHTDTHRVDSILTSLGVYENISQLS